MYIDLSLLQEKVKANQNMELDGQTHLVNIYVCVSTYIQNLGGFGALPFIWEYIIIQMQNVAL